jgi:hypothetical protein
MDEAKLIDKLVKIEALIAGAATTGERIAATEAKRKITERLATLSRKDPPVEYRFTLADTWSRRLFLALLRRYALTPYRYPGQRRTTVMVKVSRTFVTEVLWPQFEQISAVLRDYLDDVTARVVAQVIHDDCSDAPETGDARLLGNGNGSLLREP